MNRLAALRASIIFAIASFLSAAIGVAQHSPLAEATFLIAASLTAVTLLFGLAAPTPSAVPVRVRRNRR